MKSWKRWMFILALLCAVCAVGSAFGESARVVTPGGALNIRKKNDEKSKLVDSVPNKSMVEVEEVGEEWSKITYKRQSGYVKTEFLKLPSRLPGLVVYADGGDALLLRKSPDGESPIVALSSAEEPIAILAVEGEWAMAEAGEAEGWLPVSLFSYQYSEPMGKASWIEERGRVEESCPLLAAPDASSAKLADLQPGADVTVTILEKEMCLVRWADAWGYAPMASISLYGPQDGAERTGTLAPMEAAASAEAALKKQYKAFGKLSLYCIAEADGDLYRCGFFNDQDQYLYGALVDAETGGALLLADYSAFGARISDEASLPAGEMAVELSSGVLNVGGVLDISVRAWAGCKVQYTLSCGGAKIAESEPGDHFTAAYRPREAGSYTLAVTVADGSGLSKTQECPFTVEDDPGAGGMAPVYSQRDGWWADKKYRHSNLGKSGCAIFALSHALFRMGYTGEETLPENLAVKYAYCLIPGEGTSNEQLIGAAAKDFGFKTKKQLLNDKKQIAELLEQGTLFSFSIAKGHIAMVSGISEDGSMIRVVDSAPSATFERIVNAAPYYRMRSGAFRAALSLDDLPGARWYFETDEYGGLEYYLPMEYVAKRGVRLIQPLSGGET